MKKYISSIILLFVFSCGFAQTKWMMINKTNGQSDSILTTQIDKITFETKANTVLDIDGNFYHTVIIGNQEWTVENLRVTHYNDGTPILNVTDNSEWANNSTGARCSYNNDSTKVPVFGYLYNWYAVNTGKLAPATGGWRVPTDADWTTLTNFVGESIAGTKLKAKSGWNNVGNGTDDYGFSALPGGYRAGHGGFNGLGNYGYGLSSTAFDSSYAWIRVMYYDSALVGRHESNNDYGFSVRLVRDL